jgi:O-antigen ligase
MLAALVLAVLGVATIVGSSVADRLADRPTEVAAGSLAALAAVVVFAALIRRRPGALALLTLAALPFRIPLSVGGQTANLLVPLYGIIAAGWLAHALGLLRARRLHADRDGDAPPAGTRDRRLVALERTLAAVVVLYALQSLYSSDVDQAVKNLCFFYVPFAVLFRLLLEEPWTRTVIRYGLALVVAIALACAAVGFVEYATGRLLITNEKVLAANELKPYFRVNSLFFDPNIYGRFLALTMIVLAAALLWTHEKRTARLIAVVIAVLWAALVLTLSQSSFAALLVGLAVLAALRWRPGPVVALAVAGVLAAGAVVVVHPGVLGVSSESAAALNRATSGRVALVRGAVQMARDRPLWGVGSGAFAEQYRRREHVRSRRVAAVSHTMPLTIAAEQGAIGLAAYLALLWTAFSLLFADLRRTLRRRPDSWAVGGAAVAAAFCALVLHTLVYAAFLEDPLAWTLLALAAALHARARRPARDVVPAPAPPQEAVAGQLSG